LRLNVWEPFIKESFASFFVVRLAGAISVGGISEFVDMRTQGLTSKWLIVVDESSHTAET